MHTVTESSIKIKTKKCEKHNQEIQFKLES